MTQPTSQTAARWLSFRCPACRASLRIKAAYAALWGRCPECGTRIDPLKPALEPVKHISESDEPLGLAPIDDEEWPEPAQVVDKDDRENYQIAATPTQWAKPAPKPDPAGAAYDLASPDVKIKATGPVAPRRFDPPAEPYALGEAPETGPPPERHLPSEKDVALLIREPPPPPPRFPLFTGIYTFPWRPANLFVWLMTAINISLLALIAAAIIYLMEAGGYMMIGVPILLSGGGIIFAWAGMYFANCFLAIVEDTANGNDRIEWPKGGGLLDGMGKFFYLLWIVGCAFIPTILIWIVRANAISDDDWTWVVSLVPFLLIFPVLVLSAMSADAWWMLLNPKIIWNFLKRPHALALIVLPPLTLLAPCVWLAWKLGENSRGWLPFVLGFAWSTFFLLYARLLGRAGWILTGTTARKKRRVAPRRRVRVEQSQAAWDDEV